MPEIDWEKPIEWSDGTPAWLDEDYCSNSDRMYVQAEDCPYPWAERCNKPNHDTVWVHRDNGQVGGYFEACAHIRNVDLRKTKLYVQLIPHPIPVLTVPTASRPDVDVGTTVLALTLEDDKITKVEILP